MRDYLSIAGDSRRWREFEHRDGDIVISTPSKSGTTWTQMLVGLLVFDGPDFPSPMSVISPWLEFELTPATEIFDQLAAQQHRRFIKTHVPLDGLPLDDRVTYVVVGRDPRDVFLSMAPHMANLDPDAHSKALLDAVPQAEVERRLAAHASPADFAESLTLPAGNCHVNTHVAHVLHHLSTGWQRREERNVVLVHYADLQRDLVTEMGRLATALGYDYPTTRLAELAQHAGLETMRTRADALAPNAHLGAWKSASGFFAEGRMDAWRAAFSAEDLAAYDTRIAELSNDAAFLAWAHNGRRGEDWRRPAATDEGESL